MREQFHASTPSTVERSPTGETSTSGEVDVFDARTERHRAVLATLEAGTEAILTSDGFQAYLAMAAKFHRYSFQNTILIMVQQPEATLVNAYDRWKQLGRQVKKGEHGIKIFYPTFRKIEESDPDTGETRDVKRLASFGIGAVFDVSQTEGEPLPEPPDVREHLETDDKATAVHLKLARFLMDDGVTLSSEEMHGHARGYWQPDKRLIALRRAEDRSSVAIGPTRTLVHEAAHYLADHRGQIDRRDAEAVAEGSAFVTMRHFDLDVGDASFPYIAGWAKGRDVLKRNLSEIQKVSSGLITAIEGIGDPYADGYGALDRANPFRIAEDEHLEQECEDRFSGDNDDRF